MKQGIFKLLTEAVLIVFSVLLALWIERKNQESNDDDLKQMLMDRIYADIESDSVNYNQYVSRRDLVFGKLETLIKYAGSGKLAQDSLTSLLVYAEWQFSYLPSNSAYASMVSSGQLQLFERDTLFGSITHYYNYHEARMLFLSQIYGKSIDDYLTPYLNQFFDRRLFYTGDVHDAGTIDLNKFATLEFINLLIYQRDGILQRDEFVLHAKEQANLLKQIRKLRKVE